MSEKTVKYWLDQAMHSLTRAYDLLEETERTRPEEPAKKGSPPENHITRIKRALPESAISALSIMKREEKVIVSSRTWLTRPEWAEINDVLYRMGGVWVSAGKSSRWEIPVGGDAE